MLGYIPQKWRLLEVIFIPKAGKKSHTASKDLRPISLCSFMLKIMERLIDLHMRQTIDRSLLSDCQHAYTKGRSVETALHKLVNTLEYSIHHREVPMVAFLDIKGAFNNIQPQHILNELDHLRVQPLLQSVIDQLLRCRIIMTTMSSQTIQRSAPRKGEYYLPFYGILE